MSEGLPVPPSTPILLFNDECGVCRRIGHWVQTSAAHASGGPSLIVQPIGDDPVALRAIAPELDIWDAYETIHLLMPDGSMRLGGAAVAEVLRRVPSTRWFAWLFAVGVFGLRPFQSLLNLAYAVLSDVRPLFGCESCGTPPRWLRPFVAMKTWTHAVFGRLAHPRPAPGAVLHSTPMSVLGHRRRSSAT